MDLTLIPLCDIYNHHYDINKTNKRNICDICNMTSSINYNCLNCDVCICDICNYDTIIDNKKIINDIKIKLNYEFENIKKKYDSSLYDVLYYKRTGNIYIYNKIDNSTKRYTHDEQITDVITFKNRIYNCFINK